MSILLAGIALRNEPDILLDTPAHRWRGAQTSLNVGGTLGGVAVVTYAVALFVSQKRSQQRPLDGGEGPFRNDVRNQIIEPFTLIMVEKKDGGGKLSSRKAPGFWGER